VNTVNRQYPLPHKDHVVLDDLERIRATFGMIDADLVETEEKVDDTIYIVSDLENRAVHASAAIENSEIQNIAPSRYLKTTDDGTGFECVEGGGDEGGKIDQNSIKKSDKNYDTGWGNLFDVSKKGMTIQQNAEASMSNQTHMYMDAAEIENAEQLPKADLVNQQITDDVFAENNESFILRDEIEQIIGSNVTLATRKNYGFVKIGDGINDDGEKISVDEIGFASKENFGLVKIGDGIGENNEAIAVQPIGVASATTFGVVKLGADFALNTNDEMEVVKTGDEEMVIYDLAKMKIVSNGIVNLEENIAIYRAFLNEDLQFSFYMAFEPQADFSFWLEIISDGEHLIDFAEEIVGGISGVNRGITRIKFTKILGSQKWNAEVSLLEAPEPILLTPNYGDHIKSNLRLSSNGSTWDTYSMLGTDVGNIAFQSNPREIYFDFAKSAVVDYVYFYNNNTNALSLFELLGSNDKINWTRLIYKTGVAIDKNTPTEKKGAFHYFKLRFSNEANVKGIQLWGSLIENDDSELILLTPQMSSDSVAGITISCSNLRWNNVRDITSPSVNSAMEADKGSYGDPWIQYEFAKPKVTNFLDMAVHQSETQRTPRWFELLASNDGVEWDSLLERQYQEDWKQGETRYFEFENETAYKFYRLVCIYTNDGNDPPRWRISRFRLFRRESGTSSFVNCLPPLVAAEQDGYEVSANSVFNSVEAAVNAFDGNDDTRWATADGDQNNAWLKIKLPEATTFSAAYLQARSDAYYYQAPAVFKIQASNDDANWTGLIYEAASWSQKEGKIFYWFNETAYLYYRLLVESVQSGTNAGLAEFHLGTRAKSYRRHLKKYEYLTPAMTSNNTNGYIASATSQYNNSENPEGAWRAFDRSTNQWTTVSGTRTNVELKIQLPTAASCDSFAITGSNAASRSPSKFRIEGSNNGSSWTTLYEQTAAAGFGGSETKMFPNSDPDTPFLYYRLFVVENAGDGFLSVQEFSLIKESVISEY
jgi:hypothetical protein